MKQHDQVLAEKLYQAHAALMQDVRTLEVKLRPDTPSDLADLRTTLSTTQKHVLDHFRFESQNGYLNVVRQREPRLEHAIEELEDEHHRLLGTLANLREKVYAAPVLDAALRVELQNWINSLRRHEVHENALVQDAFNCDLAAED